MKNWYEQKVIASKEFHYMTIKQNFVQHFLDSTTYDYESERFVSLSVVERLQEKLDDTTVHRLVNDSFFFLYDKSKWAHFLMNVLKKEATIKNKNVVAKWQNPTFFFGEIIFVAEQYVVMKHNWTDEIVYVLDFSATEQHIGEDAFLLLVPGIEENVYYSLSMAIVLKKEKNTLFEEWKTAFEFADESRYGQFFTNQIGHCLEILANISTGPKEMSYQAKQLLLMLDAALIQLDLKSDPLFLFVHNYLKNNKLPKARKKVAVIAGAIQFGVNYHFIPQVLSVSQFAQLCDLSPSTIYHYAKLFETYYKNEFNEWTLLENEVPLFYAGTDATVEQREKWYFDKLCEEKGIYDEVNKKRLQGEELPKFVPKTSEDLAQHFAFEAYEQTYEKERVEMADTAYRYDPGNIDALLLLSDYNRHFLTEALRLVHIREQALWNRVYLKKAAFAFDERKMEQAYDALNHLTKWDENARYLQLAVLHALGEKEAVLNSLQALPENAITLWFKWGIEQSDENYTKAMLKNAFVDKYISQKADPLTYPRHCFYSEGCPTQGKFIYLLLYPFLKNTFWKNKQLLKEPN